MDYSFAINEVDIKYFRDNVENIRRKKSIQTLGQVKWNLTIKYYIHYNVPNKATVKLAIENIQNNTCIRFSRQNSWIKGDYGIHFLFRPPDESEFWGHRPYIREPQYIQGSYNCYQEVLCIQELIHYALGVRSEHTRYDRDKYVKIQEYNINPYKKYIFEKESRVITKRYSTQYDFGSFTHISPTKYSRGGTKEVVTPKHFSEHYKMMMGQKIKVSFNDYKLINKYYCDKNCTGKKLNCRNSGYQDPNNCTRCVCPNGFSGTKCENLTSSDSGCPRSHYDIKNVSLNSGLTGGEFIFFNGTRSCYVNITNQSGNQIKLTMKYLKLYNRDTKKRCIEGQGFQIKYGKDKGSMGLCFCKSYSGHQFDLISETDKVYIHYNGTSGTDGVVIDYGRAN
uniref:Metalloendopeptidase n=1 Tax=Parastrongyloides trichosuri TaxID=131310 RepID=A0A0N5A0T0_PARTI